MSSRFRDRADAGRRLAAELERFGDEPDVLVLGLPRGGVPVAAEVARALKAPLDVFLVRKLGVPAHPELALGALATGGVLVLNQDVVDAFGLTDDVIAATLQRERAELERREREYRRGRPSLDVRDRTVILVDDGLATGATMRAAATALRQLGPRRLVIAVPVGAASTCAGLAEHADEVVCLVTPEPFQAVGQWYLEFEQTSDAEVKAALAAGGGR